MPAHSRHVSDVTFHDFKHLHYNNIIEVNLRSSTGVLMRFGLVAISGIEDIPVLSYEAVMQHECKRRLLSR